jgi:fucose permease
MQTLHFGFGSGALLSPILVGAAIGANNGNPSWAFYTIAVVTLPLAGWVLLFKNPEGHQEEEKRAVGAWEKVALISSHDQYPKLIVFLVATFLLVYVGAEVCAGGYLYSYSVLSGLASKTDGAYLTSVFWGALTGTHFAIITNDLNQLEDLQLCLRLFIYLLLNCWA